MTKIQNTKQYDLEDRTFKFAKNVSLICSKFPKDIIKLEFIRQVVRSSGSTGANYIEANEALSKKDFLMRVRICRKEAKETRYWLRLLLEHNPQNKMIIEKLINESEELLRIFSSIIEKCK